MWNFLAEASQQVTGADMTSSIVMMLVLVGVFYFLLIRPENKRKKEAEKMR